MWYQLYYIDWAVLNDFSNLGIDTFVFTYIYLYFYFYIMEDFVHIRVSPIKGILEITKQVSWYSLFGKSPQQLLISEILSSTPKPVRLHSLSGSLSYLQTFHFQLQVKAPFLIWLFSYLCPWVPTFILLYYFSFNSPGLLLPYPLTPMWCFSLSW